MDGGGREGRNDGDHTPEDMPSTRVQNTCQYFGLGYTGECMLKKRYLHAAILADVKEKMVFLGGPRQVGKTTLAQWIGSQEYERV